MFKFNNSSEKNYFVVSIIAIVILSLLTFWSYSPYRQKTKDASKETVAYENLSSAERQAIYDKFLKTTEEEREASKKIIQSAISEAEVRAMVEDKLDTKQKIVQPTLADSEIKITPRTGKEVVVDYFTRLSQPSSTFAIEASADSASSFVGTGSKTVLEAQRDQAVSFSKELRGLAVPKEAVAYHKSQILAVDRYVEMLDGVDKYAFDSLDDPWSKTYRDYSILDTQTANLRNEYGSLDQKYALTEALSKIAFQPEGQVQSTVLDTVLGVKTASAFSIFNFTIGDVIKTLRDFWEDFVSTLFANFISQFLQLMIQKLDETFKISNFLHYSDALVTKYAPDYLNKYVSDPVDRAIAQRFIPQINCGKDNSDLKAIFDAKAQDYLGFDPNKPDPNASPEKALDNLRKLYDSYASSYGQENKFLAIGGAAATQGFVAGGNELLSSGYKTALTEAGKGISTALAKVQGSVVSAIDKALGFGAGNTKSTAALIAASITQALINNFVFKGGFVLQDQATCATPQYVQLVATEQVNLDATNPTDQIQVKKEVRNLSRGETSYSGTTSAFQQEVIDYRITIRLVGDKPLSSVKIADDLPSGLTIIDGTFELTNPSEDAGNYPSQANWPITISLVPGRGEAVIRYQATVTSTPRASSQDLKTNTVRVTGPGGILQQATASVLLESLQ
jgi:uncharacterized repeat protein (TIGR01451 family)